MLETTQNKLIIECTKDTLWGTGVPLENEKCLDNSMWKGHGPKGQGIMGEILCEIRKELQELREIPHGVPDTSRIALAYDADSVNQPQQYELNSFATHRNTQYSNLLISNNNYAIPQHYDSNASVGNTNAQNQHKTQATASNMLISSDSTVVSSGSVLTCTPTPAL